MRSPEALDMLLQSSAVRESPGFVETIRDAVRVAVDDPEDISVMALERLLQEGCLDMNEVGRELAVIALILGIPWTLKMESQKN